MNMFLHELKENRKSTVIWIISLVAIIVLFMMMFPMISKDATNYQSYINNLPEYLRKGFGPSINNIGTMLGFYSFLFVFVVLCGAIQAMNLGTSILSKETRERTVDFLMTKPISRSCIMTSKLLAALTLILITNIICFSAATIIASIVHAGDYDLKAFFMINATLFFTQLIFCALGVIVSVIPNKLRSVLPVSLGTVFGFFFIGMFVATDKDDAARFVTPFKYFDASYIIKNGSYETRFMIVSIILIIVAVASGYIIYSKKDIHAM